MELHLQRHMAAVANPTGPERPVILLQQAIEAYVDCAEHESDSPTGQWRDYVLGEEVGSLLDSFVGLLVGPTGRLDCGTLDTWARRMAERIGYNMDTQKYGE